VTSSASGLPDDPGLLKAMLLEERAESERLRQIIKALQRHRFGRRAESLPEDQLLLGLEEAEQLEAAGHAQAEETAPAEKTARSAKRRVNRGSLPAHLPRVETLVDVASTACPCCSGPLHCIGEDVSERLDIVPAQVRVVVIRRPKYACRACEDGVVQAPAPARLIEGGLPTDGTVAQVLVSKYADHLPLYRQAQIYARQGLTLDRSTLADWVGRAAFHLRPVHERLLDKLKASPKLFADETTAPVLDPGRGRTKTGQLWAYARDDRPWGGTDPPGVAYVYAPDRTAERPAAHLAGFQGVLQSLPSGLTRGWTATRPTRFWPGGARSSSPSAGAMCVGPFTNSPRVDRRRSPPRRSCALRRGTGLRARSAAARRTNAGLFARRAVGRWWRPSSPGCARSWPS
jgi:transposase